MSIWVSSKAGQRVLGSFGAADLLDYNALATLHVALFEVLRGEASLILPPALASEIASEIDQDVAR